MMKKILPVLCILTLIVVMVSGCNGKKPLDNMYTEDTPYDFSVIPTAAPEDPEIKPTDEPADGQATPVPGENQEDTQPTVTAAPENDSPFLDSAEDFIVPEDVTDKMTAKALVDTYVSYPMLDIICFEDDPFETYKTWLTTMDTCVEELLKRDDAVSIIIEKYKSLVNEQTKEHLFETKDIKTEQKIDWVEFLLMQDNVKSMASAKERAEIIKLAETRQSNIDINGYALSEYYPKLVDAYK